jgi:hypothetical protein
MTSESVALTRYGPTGADLKTVARQECFDNLTILGNIIAKNTLYVNKKGMFCRPEDVFNDEEVEESAEGEDQTPSKVLQCHCATSNCHVVESSFI